MVRATGREAALFGFSESMGGEQEDRRGAQRTDLARSGIAIHYGHLSVHEDHVVGLLFELLHRLRTIFDFIDDAAGTFQVAADQKAILVGIVGQENPQRSL